MKLLLSAFVLFLSGLLSYAQDGVYGDKHYRPAMDGGEQVRYDLKTPLKDLIPRLEKYHGLVETGKAYWIGYTDDMYSIAHFKQKAIGPLVKFIEVSNNENAKIAALYTLHLIGINFNVVGRFNEHFIDKDARKALIKYLPNKALSETVIYLLMRDPWLSDIPALLNSLSMPDSHHAKILSALERYGIKHPPVGQEITDAIFNRIFELNIPMSGSDKMIELYPILALQKRQPFDLLVDKEITTSQDWTKAQKEMKQHTRSQKLSLSFVIIGNKVFSFCNFKETYFHVVVDHKVYIYGPLKARALWLSWWQSLSKGQKMSFSKID